MAPGVAVSLRVLYRRDMLEVYLNDFLFPVYLMPPSRGRLGLIPSTTSLVSHVRRWEMSLPGNASWEPGASADLPAAARPWEWEHSARGVSLSGNW